MEHIKGFTVFANPTVNSYKRLVPGFEAPTYMVWSTSNRSTLVRIPASRGKGTRVELRSADPFVKETLGDHVFNNYIEKKLNGIHIRPM